MNYLQISLIEVLPFGSESKRRHNLNFERADIRIGGPSFEEKVFILATNIYSWNSTYYHYVYKSSYFQG